jgi:hypothetical protein
MREPDLPLSALQDLMGEHAGGGRDPRRLRRVLALCRELSAAIEDEYCRSKVLLVEECAAELFSVAEPRVGFLRARIREALELVQSRLYSLERARRFGQPGLARGLTARLVS